MTPTDFVYQLKSILHSMKQGENIKSGLKLLCARNFREFIEHKYKPQKRGLSILYQNLLEPTPIQSGRGTYIVKSMLSTYICSS